MDIYKHIMKYVGKNFDKIVYFLPPFAVDVGRYLFSESKYMLNGWPSRARQVKGWNEESVIEAQRKHWTTLLRNIDGHGPLGVSHLPICQTREDWFAHNQMMCYAYVLTLTARKKDKLTILDWGSGLGHYYLYSKALIPEMNIEYHCYDLPVFCRLGRELLPEVTFHEKADDVFQTRYDLVLSSSSLHYFENWPQIIHKLARVTGLFLYIARLQIVHERPSFTVLNKPHHFGYYSEFYSWFLNRQDFLKRVEEEGMELVREFLSKKFYVKGVAERCEERGFLFRPRE